jgi:hypothetical protein
VLEWHTIESKLAGLFSGGVPFLPVANDGTSTSPGISPPSPLDFRRRRAPLLLVWLFFAGAPCSGGKGSDMVHARLQNDRDEWNGVKLKLELCQLSWRNSKS